MLSRARAVRTFITASVLLFTLQALRAAFSSLFGIIYDQIFEGPLTAWLGISNGLLWLALLIPPLLMAAASRRLVYGMAILSALARIALTFEWADLRYGSSLILILAGSAFLAGVLLWHRGAAARGLVAALVADQGLRALGSTYDLSLHPEWIPIQVGWSLALILGVLWIGRQESEQDVERAGISPWVGFGLGAWLFLETSLLSLPNALARWSEGAYSLAAPALLAFTVGPSLLVLRGGEGPSIWEAGPARWGASLMAAAGLMLGYFFKGWPAMLALLMAQAGAMAAAEIMLAEKRPASRRGGGWLMVGGILFLVLHYFNAFAFTYAYTLPFMRQLGWQIYLAAAVALGMGVSFAEPPPFARRRRTGRSVQAGLVAAAATAGVAMVARPSSVAPLPENGALRLATYNIHYGYDEDWRFTLEGQAKSMEREDIDIIALQEVDAGRITSYGVDDAYYLARRLGMDVTYLPTVEHLTGIAVLHKGEALWTEEQWLPSLQEQTGIIGVGLSPDVTPFAVFGVWLGLESEDTNRQIQEALAFLGETTPAAFAGDFNALEGGPVVSAVEAAGFIDPFRALGLDPPATSPALSPFERIDYVWIRGLLPIHAWVPDSLASDHRPVVVTVGFLP